MRSAAAFGILAALVGGALLLPPCGPCCTPEQRPVSFALADCCDAPSGNGCAGQIRSAAAQASSLPAAAGPAAILAESVADPPRPTFARAAAPALLSVPFAGFPGFTRPLLV
jgi:hypothetical protein